jgi:hypothetical protein
MSRLIFVPQFPAAMRYQEFWYTEFIENFKKHYDKVIVLGTKHFLKSAKYFYEDGSFSPVDKSIEYEMQQIRDYMNLPLKDDDTLFLSDISFPGIFINALYHKRPKRMYAYCHGTSKNCYDYYAPLRKQKFMVETGHSKLFDAIFIGSYYHQNKLRKWYNTVVVGVPENPYVKHIPSLKRHHLISSVARPSIQKVNNKLEKEIQRRTGIKINRGVFNTWEEYSRFLSNSKLLLITSKEDTFGYTVLDAIQCGCNVIAPNKLAFRELLDREFRYDNIDDLHEKINNILSKLYTPQKLQYSVQRKVDNFYDSIMLYMKGD